MKKACLAFLVSTFTLVLSAQQINDPNAELREAKNFHGISVSHAFDVYIDQSGTEAIAVSAPTAGDRERIKVEVKDGILHIGMDKKWSVRTGNKKFKAYISVSNIDELDISGACDVYINGTLKAANLSIDQSGASDLKGKIEVDKLSVDLSGASDINLTGKATQVHIQVSGASSFKGYDLETETCHAEASGSSDIKVTVNKELSADASGASDINYRGNGVIREMKSSGSGSVNKGK
jgi:hypothetical protein